MCLYPRLIRNRKYEANKKNKGIVPELKDERCAMVPVGCGKCMECLKQNARNWQVRLQEEIRHNKNGLFVTMSFSNESLMELEKEYDKTKIIKSIRKTITLKNGKKRNYYNYEEKKTKNKLKGYELDNAIAKTAVRKFLERWRKAKGKSIKHWLVTELGQRNTERVHIHGIIWTNEKKEEIEHKWKYGNVWIGEYVNEKTINYIVKYISKTDMIHKEYKPKILTSAGIGRGYMERIDSKNNKYKGEETREYYKTRSGHKMALPIYYRNHIYNEEEKEKLWIQKLDKEVRYVNGKKIDISKNEEVYYGALEMARKRNKEFGHGDNEINWKRRNYENERRNLKKMERWKKTWRNE